LTKDPEVKGAIKHVREFLTQEDHPAKNLFHRVFDTLSEEKRRRLFQSLFLNAWFIGGGKGITGKKSLGFAHLSYSF